MAKEKMNWGTIIGLVAVAIAGGAWYLNRKQQEAEAGGLTPGPYAGTGFGGGGGQTYGGGNVPSPSPVGGALVATINKRGEIVVDNSTPTNIIAGLLGTGTFPFPAAAVPDRTIFSGAGVQNVTIPNILGGVVRAVYTTPQVAASAPVPASLNLQDIAAANSGAKAGALDAYGNPTNYDKSGMPIAGAAPIVPVLPGFDQYGHAIPGVVAPTNNTGFSQGVSGWPSGIPVLTPSQAKQAPAGAIYVRTDGGYSPALQDQMNS